VSSYLKRGTLPEPAYRPKQQSVQQMSAERVLSLLGPSHYTSH